MEYVDVYRAIIIDIWMVDFGDETNFKRDEMIYRNW